MTVTKEDIADARVQIHRLRECLAESNRVMDMHMDDAIDLPTPVFIALQGVMDADGPIGELSSFITKLST